MTETRRRIVAAAYPASLLLLIALLRWVGERWLVTCFLLYVPRLLFAAPLPFVLWMARRSRGLLALQLGSLGLLLVLLGFVPPGGDAAVMPGKPVLRVLSFNVMHAYAGPERIVAQIDRFSPDVVLLQKLSVNFGPVVQLLAARYRSVEFADGYLVASRFPVLSTEPIERLPSDGAVRRVLDTSLGPIAFYSIHPMSPRKGLFKFGPAGWRQLRRDTDFRLAELRALGASADAESLPVIIAGDTNVPSLSPVWSRDLGRYRDGFAAVGWGLGYTYPFNWVRWLRIDRVLASAPLRFVGFQRGDSSASDHVCVVADLQRR